MNQDPRDARIEELEAERRSGAKDERPNLEHQPEIVDSPGSSDAKATGAQSEAAAGTIGLTDTSEDPTRTA